MTRKELVDILGLDCALRLCRACGGESIVVPRSPLSATERVVEVDDGEMSAAEVARVAGVSRATVWRARAGE